MNNNKRPDDIYKQVEALYNFILAILKTIGSWIKVLLQTVGKGIKVLVEYSEHELEAANQRAQAAQYQARIQQINNFAVANYYDAATMVAEAIAANPNLGLLAPGIPTQIMMDAGVGVDANGNIYYCFLTARKDTTFQQSNTRNLQAELNAVCYRNCFFCRMLIKEVRLEGINCRLFVKCV